MRGWILSAIMLFGALTPVLTEANPTAADQPEREYQLMLKLIETNRPGEALTACAGLIQKHPEFYRTYPVYLNLAQRENRLAEALSLLQGVSTATSGCAAASFGLGLCYSRLGDSDKAWDCYSRAAELPDASPAVYTEWVFCAQQKRQLNELRQRLEDRSDDPLAGLGAGIAWSLGGDFDHALKCYRNSLALAAQRGDSVLQASCLNKISIAHFYKGELQPALQAATQSLQLARQLNNSAVLPSYLTQLGIVSSNLQQDEVAVECFTEAIRLAEKTADDGMRGGILLNLGNIHINRSELRQARDCYAEGLAITRRQQDRRSEGFALLQMGFINMKFAAFQNALGDFNQSLAIGRELQDKYIEAMSLINLGGVYTEVNDPEQAEVYYRRVLELPITKASKDIEGQTLSRMGTCLMSQGKYDQAQAAIERASLIFAQIDKGFEQGVALLHGAILLLKQGQLSQAVDRANEMLSLCQRNGYDYLTGSAYLLLAEAHLRARKGDQANDCALKALAIIEPAGHRCELPEVYYKLGRIAELQGKLQSALEYYRQAVNTSENIRQQLGYEGFRTNYQAGWTDLYRSTVSLLIELSRRHRGRGYEQEAFAFCERAKARVFLDRLRLRRDEIRADVNPRLLEQRLELDERLSEAEMRWQALNRDNDGTAKEKARLQARINDLRRQYQHLLVRIALDHPVYASIIGIGRPPAVQEIQAFLAPGEAVVEYLAVENGVIVFILGRDFFDVHSLPVSPLELGRMIDRLYQPIADFHDNQIDLLHLEWDRRVAYELYQAVMAPLEGKLARLRQPGRRVPHLIIVPDEALCFLPFEALVTATPAGGADDRLIFAQYRATPFLLQRYAFSYAASASVLNPHLRKKLRPASGRLLALANPHLGQEGVSPAGSSGDRARRAYGPAMYSPLPGAEQEVQDIASVVGLDGSRVLIGEDATEGNFKREAGRYKYLHLATHGLVDSNRSDHSCLMMACDARNGEDGYLRIHEIYNLDLCAELVVMSACETARGELLQGEGIIGLSRAFLGAGARKVVASLWPVEDNAGKLMQTFYQELKQGVATEEALRQAKLRFLESTRPIGADRMISQAHPFFWAPFILCGK